MFATKDFVIRKFNMFNNKIFNGSLPQILITISRDKAFLGKFLYRNDKTCKLCINGIFDFTPDQLDDTIIHEMIHYYIFVNNIKDNAPHGNQFKALMHCINERHNRNIVISHKYTNEEINQIRSIVKPHLLCLVQLSNGQMTIKAVPRIIQRIKEVHKKIIQSFSIISCKWFFSYDPFFNKFPISSTVKLYFISDNEINEHIVNAKDVTNEMKKYL